MLVSVKTCGSAFCQDYMSDIVFLFVLKVNWTRREWVQVSSMEMLRWGSCDSREAPPHRINSSVIARGRGGGSPPSPQPTGPHRQDAPYRSALLLEKETLPQYWYVCMSVIIPFVSFLFPRLSSRCFLVCGTVLSAVSHTLDHLDKWRSLQPLCPCVSAGKPLSVNMLGSFLFFF